MTDGQSIRVVFDLDGTLIDSIGSLAAAGARLTTEMGRPSVSVEKYATFVGRGISAQVRDLLKATGGLTADDGQAAIARFNELYAEDPLSNVREYPSARNALLALASEGCVLGVCTQKPEHISRKILSALGHMPPVSTVVGGDTLSGILKPDARMLEAASAPLGTGPLIYVGDSSVDAETASNLGVPFILTEWGYRTEDASNLRHDAVLRSFDELPALVGHLMN